ncbi:MAG: DegQ family serine endoprotease [Deltaproteobacteria bacterium]|nr:DegQ family serine endoprotease [Deltaproteobacteria bacterium]
MNKKGYRILGVGVLILASVVVGLILSARMSITTPISAKETKLWSTKPETQQETNLTQKYVPASFSPLVNAVKGAVVNISTTKIVKTVPMNQQMLGNPMMQQFQQFFGPHFQEFLGPQVPQEYKEHALGSGFIINKDGYILTNNHVIAGMSDIKVITDNGDQYTAKVIGTDPKTDIALLKIDPKKALDVAYLGDSSKVQVGDWVVVIGNPFGLDHTVTAGIISAEGRRLSNESNYDQFLQTDAAINRGNSGGPVFNLKGEVIGISTAIIAPSIGQGIGFAIPINVAKTILPQLLAHGKVVRGWLGVYIQDITPDLAESFHLKRNQKGAVVTKVVKDGPAYKAGIREGDVIIKFDDKRIKSADVLPWIVSNVPVNSKASVVVIRHGKEKTFTVTIGELPSNEQIASESVKKKESASSAALGITVENITPGVQNQYRLQTNKGVIITNVASGSPADMAGIQNGDVVRQVNQQAVNNVNEYNKLISKVKKGEMVSLLISRGNANIYVAMTAQ